MVKGVCERLGSNAATMTYEIKGQQKIEVAIEASNHEDALKYLFEYLTSKETGVIKDLNEISAIGHRVVHGGEKFASSVLVTDQVMDVLDECKELAPLHNPPNIVGINACKKLMPNVPMVAVFDTAFHQTMPAYSYMYGLPYDLYKKYGVRRYGFHGTSHRYVSDRAALLLGKAKDDLCVITCHLGNGSSISAVKNGKCIDTSMGFTPLEGLIMGTRSGDIDPAIVGFIATKMNMTADEVCQKYLNKESGFLGLSGGLSNDFRNLQQEALKGNDLAQLTIDVLVYRIVKYIGSYAAAMGKLDGIVFTAGIGENSSFLREKVCEKLTLFGIKLDNEKNNLRQTELVISTPDSAVSVMVIPTNEELVIARDTVDIVKNM